jgi:hypothetical protein
MKFFSNEAKENTDGPDYDRESGDVVTSDPVSVPQQRAGSPWSDTPGNADDELATREQRDGTDEGWGSAPETAPESATTTTYGPDGTVTESVDKDADAEDEAKDDVAKDDALKDEGTFDSPEAVDPVTDEPLDKSDSLDESDKSDAQLDAERASTDEEDTLDEPSATVVEEEDKDSATAEEIRAEDEAEDAEEAAEDEADDETAKTEDEQEAAVKHDDTYDGPDAVDPTTGDSLDDVETEHHADEVVEPVGAVPVAVVDTAPADTFDTAPADTFDTVPVTEADPVPVAAVAGTPGSVSEPAVDRLFPGGDSFAERFREIQLVFVDNPKEATAQAATLVTEAVDAITSALNEQKNALAAGSDDTEQLRVELRGYRDMLDRLTGL